MENLEKKNRYCTTEKNVHRRPSDKLISFKQENLKITNLDEYTQKWYTQASIHGISAAVFVQGRLKRKKKTWLIENNTPGVKV